jgi:subtilase family serine protease
LTPAIAPGSSVDVTIPGHAVCRTGCVLTIVVDAQNEVPESDETNNTVAKISCPVIVIK